MRLIACTLVCLVAGLACAASAQAKLVFERDGAIWTANEDGSLLRRVTTGTAPEPSPDGRWIAYLRAGRRNVRPGTDLWVRPIRGGQPRRLLEQAVGITWDHDSRRIISERGGRLYAVGPRIRRARRTVQVGEDCGSSFAPDGRLAVAECGQITVLNRRLEPASQRDLVEGRNPLWGTRGLAFAWQNGDGRYQQATVSQLRLLTPGGKRRTILATDGRGVVPVTWSADGACLLVQLGAAPAVVSVGTGAVRRQMPDGQAQDLSADGSRALVRRDDGLHAIVVADGSDRLVAPGAANGRSTL